jgi:hypothetical protein
MLVYSSTVLRRCVLAFGLPLIFIAFIDTARADAQYEAWSATLYGGPSTTKFASQIFLDGNFDPTGEMAGLALDRRIFYLGSGFSFGGEVQLTQFGGNHVYTVGSVGLGVRYSFQILKELGSLAVYTGPSYTTDPPLTGIGFNDADLTYRGIKLLNYVGVELAFAIPSTQHWDVVARIYHRSGAFGLYSLAADEGSAFGLGVRLRF